MKARQLVYTNLQKNNTKMYIGLEQHIFVEETDLDGARSELGGQDSRDYDVN